MTRDQRLDERPSGECRRMVPVGLIINRRTGATHANWKKCKTRACPECGPKLVADQVSFWERVLTRVVFEMGKPMWVVEMAADSAARVNSLLAYVTINAELALRIPGARTISVYTTVINPSCRPYSRPLFTSKIAKTLKLSPITDHHDGVIDGVEFRSLHELLQSQLEPVPPRMRVRPTQHLQSVAEEQKTKDLQASEVDHDPDTEYVPIVDAGQFIWATARDGDPDHLPEQGTREWMLTALRYGLGLDGVEPDAAALLAASRQRRKAWHRPARPKSESGALHSSAPPAPSTESDTPGDGGVA